jgi:anti-anti-sigma regulatory factor
MPAIELVISKCDGSVVVALRGDLDVTGVPDTESTIAALMARDQWLARRSGGDVILAAPQSHARRLLALTGKDETFWGQPSLAAAVAASRATGGDTLGGGAR